MAVRTSSDARTAARQDLQAHSCFNLSSPTITNASIRRSDCRDNHLQLPKPAGGPRSRKCEILFLSQTISSTRNEKQPIRQWLAPLSEFKAFSLHCRKFLFLLPFSSLSFETHRRQRPNAYASLTKNKKGLKALEKLLYTITLSLLELVF